jgi:orotidine-5'-phosphate decarboxylase
VKAPIAVALDAPDLGTMAHWAKATAPVVQCLKVGLEVFMRDGRDAVAIVQDTDCDLFLDVKLHDIPATVAGAAGALADLAPTYLTVHASGGPAMIEAAANALPQTAVTAVTVLTSLDAATLMSMGWTSDPEALAVTLASMAVAAGARAIVCSPQEVSAIRSVVPADITLITPGVRPAGSAAGDQRRVATPAQARAAGADLLVIGRPITGQSDVAAAARAIAEEVWSA